MKYKVRKCKIFGMSVYTFTYKKVKYIISEELNRDVGSPYFAPSVMKRRLRRDVVSVSVFVRYEGGKECVRTGILPLDIIEMIWTRVMNNRKDRLRSVWLDEADRVLLKRFTHYSSKLGMLVDTDIADAAKEESKEMIQPQLDFQDNVVAPEPSVPSETVKANKTAVEHIEELQGLILGFVKAVLKENEDLMAINTGLEEQRVLFSMSPPLKARVKMHRTKSEIHSMIVKHSAAYARALGIKEMDGSLIWNAMYDRFNVVTGLNPHQLKVDHDCNCCIEAVKREGRLGDLNDCMMYVLNNEYRIPHAGQATVNTG